ncbi:MAG: A/G-specific adenine glycosylase [Bacteroidetes bacterium]|nr:A/G-specific adenine glycosylase [Bacteroidota bacterium]
MNNSIKKLLVWYQKNERQLPWRQTSNPYYIWLSEVILQQTRVDQGLPYYIRFTQKYPDIALLASANEQDVFKLWQGLGYYSRATNMLKAAREIVSSYHGEFPKNMNLLMKLPGVGSYTAAAIASMAFNMPHGVVDGNVYRVLSRLYGIVTPINSSRAHTQFLVLTEELMSTHSPALFNQAMMELGALVCKPQNPDCLACPLQSNCFAFAHKQQGDFPVKSPKAKQKTRYLTYYVISITTNGHAQLFLNQRKSTGIWANLFDFPSFETHQPLPFDQAIHQAIDNGWLPNNSFNITQVSNEYKHLLTHRILRARFISIQISGTIPANLIKSLLLINQTSLSEYPVPVLVERYLRDVKLIE